MIALDELSPDTRLQADLCIIGGGFCGLTLAWALRNSGLQILVVEAGGVELDGPTQEQFECEHHGLLPVNDGWSSRTYQIGGSSQCWGGFCIPFDSSILAGWPIPESELRAALEEAHRFLWLEGDLDSFQRPQDFVARGPMPALGAGLRLGLRQVSKFRIPQHRGAEILGAPTIRLLTQAFATGVTLSPDRRRVESLTVQSLGGRSARVEASRFVLAASGIENPRLLQIWDRALQGALLQGNGHVGAWLSDHAEILVQAQPWRRILPRMARRKATDTRPDWRVSSFLQLAPDATAETFPDHALIVEDWARAALEPKHVNWPEPAPPSRISPRGALRPGLVETLLQVAAKPVRESRVGLSDSRQNALGQPLALIDWRLDAGDLPRFIRLAEALEAALITQGIGRLKLADQLRSRGVLDETGLVINGRHWMGAVRMARSEADGAVDPDLRLFAQSNLHVLGASAFPSHGWPGPTFMALALAFRLARHLER